jgi:EAL domain-containing protein (putative c-di-GMP-specific phosphodiesterase class I)
MMADEIVSALNNRRLAIAFQPIVRADSEQPALYECLLRLIKPDNEVVSAGHFIPVAEQLGLVRLIDHRVLELAVETLSEGKDARLSLNISGMTATDPRWLSNLTSFLSAHRETASRLTVEITETVALHDLEESSRFITKLRDLGCRVAIDDFGAGYTSFRNLKTLAVDMVKLDGAFCDQLHDNKDNQFFVRTLIALAKNFGVETVAEWVQDKRDADLLKDMGVDYLQGFLYGAASMEKPWISGGDAHASRIMAL